jgi:toxin ParE1/3/4
VPAVVILSESALRDLRGIRDWYAEEGVPEVGARLVQEILARLDPLRQNPDLGRIVPEFEQALLRELIHPPFRIVYRRNPTRVRVVRVWRSERLLRLPLDEAP